MRVYKGDSSRARKRESVRAQYYAINDTDQSSASPSHLIQVSTRYYPRTTSLPSPHRSPQRGSLFPRVGALRLGYITWGMANALSAPAIPWREPTHEGSIIYVLNVRMLLRILRRTRRSDVHSNCIFSKVSSSDISAATGSGVSIPSPTTRNEGIRTIGSKINLQPFERFRRGDPGVDEEARKAREAREAREGRADLPDKYDALLDRHGHEPTAVR